MQHLKKKMNKHILLYYKNNHLRRNTIKMNGNYKKSTITDNLGVKCT